MNRGLGCMGSKSLWLGITGMRGEKPFWLRSIAIPESSRYASVGGIQGSRFRSTQRFCKLSKNNINAEHTEEPSSLSQHPSPMFRGVAAWVPSPACGGVSGHGPESFGEGGRSKHASAFHAAPLAKTLGAHALRMMVGGARCPLRLGLLGVSSFLAEVTETKHLAWEDRSLRNELAIKTPPLRSMPRHQRSSSDAGSPQVIDDFP